LRYVQAKDLIPGMLIGRQIISEDGITLLAKGTSLTAPQIEILRGWQVPFLYICDIDSEINADNSPLLFLSKASFMHKYEEALGSIKNIFENAKHFNQIPISDLRQLVSQLITPLIRTLGALDFLYEMKMHSDDTLQHSINVAVMVGIFGRWLNYKASDHENLVLAGLLHDLGKLYVPLAILHKPGTLSASEFIVIKKHSEQGYAFVKDSTEIPVSAKMAILQHHERLDGSGYPLGLKDGAIHDFAKIVAVADIYDAMTSDRPYRPKLTPFVAVECIAEQMYNGLDVNVCLPLLDNMRDYFMGSHVLLSNGQRAQIIVLPHNNWTNPTVRTGDGIFLDLRKEKINIIDLIES